MRQMKMNYFIGLLLGATLLSINSCKHEYQVTGHLDKFDKSELCLVKLPNDGTRGNGCDTVFVINGDFEFDVDSKFFTEFILTTFNESGKPSYKPFIHLYALPGESVHIFGAIDSISTSGSKFYNDVKRFDASLEDVHNAMNALSEEYKEASSEKNEAALDSLQSVSEVLMSQMYDCMIAFVKENSGSDVAAYAAANIFDDKKFFQADSLVSDRVKKGVMSEFLDGRRKNMESVAKRRAAKESLVAGSEAPDFSLPTPDGENLSLSSLRGKWVMLDFWGSWCSWCIKAIPTLKDIYSKYSDVFEIVSVDCGDTEEKWEKALESHKMPWTQVFNGKAEVDELFGIEAYPTFCFIDPDGRMGKVFSGMSDELINYADEVLNARTK